MLLQTFYPVRFNHCDPFGHLNNSAYIDYMINAREDHLKQFHKLDLDSFYKKGIGWVVSSHEIQYVRPANYNETVCIQSELIELGENYVIVEIRMLDENGANLKALLWSRFTCINIRTGKKENHTAEFMEIAKQFAVDHVNVQEGIKSRLAKFRAAQLT